MITNEDLMIGDWINTLLGISRVVCLDDGIMFKGKDKNGEDVFFRDGGITLKPIPITPEILEKNGFKSDTNLFGLCDYELSESYILENRGDRFSFVKRITKHGSTFHIIDINYVHELQHTLHLCRIKHEITL